MSRITSIVGLLTVGAACAKGIPIPEPTPTVSIPAGVYTIGEASFGDLCPQAACSAAAAPRQVEFTHAFSIEQHEVTIRQYAACMELEHCCWDDRTDMDHRSHGGLPARVTIDEARQYCAWRGRRLATEAEWEVAARLKPDRTLQPYPWGDTPKTCSEVRSSECTNSIGPMTVGSNPFDQTPLGIQDMAGNLSEWVDDDFSPYVGCRFQTPLAVVCGSDGNCYSNICAGGACRDACSEGQSWPCQTVSSGGALCLSSAVAAQNPLYARAPRPQTGPGNCGASSMNGQIWPTVKGGGVDAMRCQQLPARRRWDANSGGGTIGGDGDGQSRHAFRCVEDPAGATAPTPLLSSGFFLMQPLACGVIRISPKAAAPSGWGTRIKVALLSRAGFTAGTYDAPTASYSIDISALPGCSNSSLGNNRIVLSGLDFARYDLTVVYPTSTYFNSQPCARVKSVLALDLTNGETSCSEFGNVNPTESCEP